MEIHRGVEETFGQMVQGSKFHPATAGFCPGFYLITRATHFGYLLLTHSHEMVEKPFLASAACLFSSGVQCLSESLPGPSVNKDGLPTSTSTTSTCLIGKIAPFSTFGFRPRRGKSKVGAWTRYTGFGAFCSDPDTPLPLFVRTS